MKRIGRLPKQMVDGKYQCSRCKEYKYPSEFSKSNASAHGYQSKCKLCQSQMHFIKHPPKIKIISETIVCKTCGIEKARSDFQKGCLKCKKCTYRDRQPYFRKYAIESRPTIKAYQERNKERIQRVSKQHYEKNKETILAKCAAYRELNREKIRLAAVEYRKSHRKQINDYIRNRKQTDIEFMLMTRLKSRFMEIIGDKLRGGNSKAIKKFVGITFEELKDYLESKFTDGMTWENHGTHWHIDHIIPCAAFDPSDENQVAMCFHYSNLQPLAGSENSSKQDILPNGQRARDLRGNMEVILPMFSHTN